MCPILFQFGPLRLYSYGLMVALGFLAAITVAVRRSRAVGIDPARIQNVGLAALLAGILGARLTYVLLNWELFRSNPIEILRLDHGGLVFYGGLAAGVIAGTAALRAKGMPVLRGVDLLIPPLVLAHAVGRIGCFLNGCCYGKPSSVPWAVAFPFDGVPRHPTQLYEAAFLILLFVWLGRQVSSVKCQEGPGRVLLLYGVAYGIWRFLIEFLRGDNPAVAFGLTVFQLASIGIVLICGTLFLLKYR